MARIADGRAGGGVGKPQPDDRRLRKEIAAKWRKVQYDESADAKEPATLTRAEYVWIDDASAGGREAVQRGGVQRPMELCRPSRNIPFSAAKSRKCARLRA